MSLSLVLPLSLSPFLCFPFLFLLLSLFPSWLSHSSSLPLFFSVSLPFCFPSFPSFSSSQYFPTSLSLLPFFLIASLSPPLYLSVSHSPPLLSLLSLSPFSLSLVQSPSNKKRKKQTESPTSAVLNFAGLRLRASKLRFSCFLPLISRFVSAPFSLAHTHARTHTHTLTHIPMRLPRTGITRFLPFLVASHTRAPREGSIFRFILIWFIFSGFQHRPPNVTGF